MIYFIGDLHRNWYKIQFICKHYHTTKNDICIVLGDSELNYFLDERDDRNKKKLNKLPITLLIIQGNHDCRPNNIKTYKKAKWNNGIIYVEEKYPSLLFAKDGEIYSIYNKTFLVCGGAYSVDKFVRLKNNIPWWEDEQPSNEIKIKVENVLKNNKWKVDYIITHTCPLKYEPLETFGTNSYQNIDKTTEQWLNTLEEKTIYKHWYCGHFHIDKEIDNISFIYNSPHTLKL